jgi:hypothetical protein
MRRAALDWGRLAETGRWRLSAGKEEDRSSWFGRKQKKEKKEKKNGSENREEKGREEERNKVYSSYPKKPHKEVETLQDN